VKWDLVTKPKDEGGLGVRDLRRVNLSLLANWQWRFLDPSQSGWKALLIAKYGVHLASDDIQQLNGDVRRASTWWKDICNLQGDRRWFEQATVKKVGDGGALRFGVILGLEIFLYGIAFLVSILSRT
jgi:hypothetical protein